MSIRIRELDAASAGAWDAFVRATPEATFFHRAPWAEVIRRSFGHATHYVFAEQDGAIVGVLPLARMKTLLFGDLLASTPFCVYGGSVAVEEPARLALEAHALALREKLGSPALEFRRQGAEDAGWLARPPLYYTFRKPIVPFDDDTKGMEKNIPRKQRAEVRKGLTRFGLRSVSDSDTDRLHAIYAESVRNLGSPVFPRRYFRALAEAFPGEHDVTTVLHGDAPVAAVLNFHFRGEVLPYYGGGTRAARGLSANDVMYWEVMRRAHRERGATRFDFGRSKAGTGAFDYKKNWGFAPEQLHYCYRLAAGAQIPENNPNNPKYRLFIRMWKKLPLPVANLLGPPLVRGLDKFMSALTRIAKLVLPAPAVARLRLLREGLDAAMAERPIVACDTVDGFLVAYRARTPDEEVISHSFDRDIFFPALGEAQPGPDENVLDIGAHIGTFSLLAAKRAPGGVVHAVEASAENAALARINVAMNGLGNATVHHLALTDRPGRVRLHHDPGGSWGHSITQRLSLQGEDVAGEDLAGFLARVGLQRVGLAKLNCEGAEFPILMACPVEVLRRIERMLVLYHAAMVGSPYSLDGLLGKLAEAGFATEILHRSASHGWIRARRP